MPTLAPGLEFSSSAPELDVGSDAGGALGSVAIASAVGRPEVLLLVVSIDHAKHMMKNPTYSVVGGGVQADRSPLLRELTWAGPAIMPVGDGDDDVVASSMLDCTTFRKVGVPDALLPTLPVILAKTRPSPKSNSSRSRLGLSQQLRPGGLDNSG